MSDVILENSKYRKYRNSLGHIVPPLRFHKISNDYDFPNVDPYEPRKFPLTDDEYEKMQQEGDRSFPDAKNFEQDESIGKKHALKNMTSSL